MNARCTSPVAPGSGRVSIATRPFGAFCSASPSSLSASSHDAFAPRSTGHISQSGE